MQLPVSLFGVSHTELIVGPWPCEACGKLSQYAAMMPDRNRIFCRNENCGYQRTVDKRRARIVENDGSQWAFDDAGNKWRVRNQ